MSDLNSVFRDQPIKQDSKVSGFLGWLLEDLKDALPKKRDTSKPRSVLDEPRGLLSRARHVIGYFYFDGESAVATVASGDRFKGKALKRGGSLHEVTWSCKALTMVLSAVVVVGLSNGNLSSLFWNALPFAYVIAYQWMFKVRITDDQVTVMNRFFQMQTFDLADVVHINQKGRHGYSLHFANGKKTYLFKFVNGHRDLIEQLELQARA